MHTLHYTATPDIPLRWQSIVALMDRYFETPPACQPRWSSQWHRQPTTRCVIVGPCTPSCWRSSAPPSSWPWPGASSFTMTPTSMSTSGPSTPQISVERMQERLHLGHRPRHLGALGGHPISTGRRQPSPVRRLLLLHQLRTPSRRPVSSMTSPCASCWLLVARTHVSTCRR